MLRSSPLAVGFWVAAVAGFVAPMLVGRFLRLRPKPPVEAEPD